MSDRSAGIDSMQDIFFLYSGRERRDLSEVSEIQQHSSSLGVFSSPIIPTLWWHLLSAACYLVQQQNQDKRELQIPDRDHVREASNYFCHLHEEGWMRIHHVLISKVDRTSECRVSIQICSGLIQWRAPLTCAFSVYVCCIHHWSIHQVLASVEELMQMCFCWKCVWKVAVGSLAGRKCVMEWISSEQKPIALFPQME